MGEGLSGVIAAEAAKLKKLVWTKYIRATLADFQSGGPSGLQPRRGKTGCTNCGARARTPGRGIGIPALRVVGEYLRLPARSTLRRAQDASRRRADRLPLTPELVAASGVDDEIVAMLEEMSPTLFAREVEAKFTRVRGRGVRRDERIPPFERWPTTRPRLSSPRSTTAGPTRSWS